MRDLYRYVDMKAYSDQGAPLLVLVVYTVVRETPKCWFIKYEGRERRVLKGFGKRFAHETLEWAQLSWRKRKRWQASHLRHQLAHVEQVLKVEDTDFPVESEPDPGHFSVGSSGDGYREYYKEAESLKPKKPNDVYGGLFF